MEKLSALASSGQWQHLQEHTSHPDSGFDWWMFPIDKPSMGQGDLYKLSEEDIRVLKEDPVFMENYRRGVCLIAQSWGWDLESGNDLTNASQNWTGYTVRLYKMITSLELFEQFDLLQSLKGFMDRKGVSL